MVGEWAVKQLARRLKFACALRGAVWWMLAAMIVWGSTVVVMRLVWRVSPAAMLTGAAGVGMAALVGGLLAARKTPSQDQLRALLDSENACGGVLMSACEVPVDGWADRVIVHRIPTVSWNKRKAMVLLVASMGYVGLALFLPQRFISADWPGSVAAEREIEKLQQRLEKLREMGLVEQQRFAELHAELQQIRKSAQAQEPGKTQEALDHLEQALKQLATEGLQKRQEGRELVQQARDLADAMKELSKSDGLQPGEAQLANQALEKLLQEASARLQSSSKAQQLKEFLEKHQDGSAFSDEELAELADLLDELLEGEELDLKELADLGWIDPELLKNLKKVNARLINAEWLRAQLRFCEGECDLDELLLVLMKARGGTRPAGSCGLPGRGGITRGRGDAELTFGKPSSAEGVVFKPEALKPGALHHLEAPLVQVRRVKPSQEQRETSQGGALGKTAGVGEGHERQILPRHRTAVRQYFQSGR